MASPLFFRNGTPFFDSLPAAEIFPTTEESNRVREGVVSGVTVLSQNSPQ
jgi:hypothetical protein